MDGSIQIVAVNVSIAKSRSATSCVPQGSTVEYIFSNDICNDIKSTLSKSADDTKLNGATDTLERRDASRETPTGLRNGSV